MRFAISSILDIISVVSVCEAEAAFGKGLARLASAHEDERLTPTIDLPRLQALIDLVASTPITELDLAEGKLRIRIIKAAGPASAATSGAALSQSAAGQPPAAAPTVAKLMRAPMAGTFFTTPSPSDPPFVQLGGLVAKGATVCIIEAMKTLTRVPAGQDGILLKVLAVPGAFVEYDQPLFEIG